MAYRDRMGFIVCRSAFPFYDFLKIVLDFQIMQWNSHNWVRLEFVRGRSHLMLFEMSTINFKTVNQICHQIAEIFLTKYFVVIHLRRFNSGLCQMVSPV